MTRNNRWRRMIRFMTVAAVGGSAFQLGGCDPAVRGTVLDGFEAASVGLANTFITAFFQSLEDDGSGTGLTTT